MSEPCGARGPYLGTRGRLAQAQLLLATEQGRPLPCLVLPIRAQPWIVPRVRHLSSTRGVSLVRRAPISSNCERQPYTASSTFLFAVSASTRFTRRRRLSQITLLNKELDGFLASISPPIRQTRDPPPDLRSERPNSSYAGRAAGKAALRTMKRPASHACVSVVLPRVLISCACCLS